MHFLLTGVLWPLPPDNSTHNGLRQITGTFLAGFVITMDGSTATPGSTSASFSVMPVSYPIPALASSFLCLSEAFMISRFTAPRLRLLSMFLWYCLSYSRRESWRLRHSKVDTGSEHPISLNTREIPWAYPTESTITTRATRSDSDMLEERCLSLCAKTLTSWFSDSFFWIQCGCQDCISILSVEKRLRILVSAV